MGKKVSVSLLGLFGILLLYIPITILHGWVLSILWGWFAVPIFGFKLLTIVQTIGIGMVVSFMTTHISFWKNLEQDIAREISFSITRPIFTLGVGWIVKQFM